MNKPINYPPINLSSVRPGEKIQVPGVMDVIPGAGEPVYVTNYGNLIPTFHGVLTDDNVLIEETSYIGLYPTNSDDRPIILSNIQKSRRINHGNQEKVVVLTNHWDQNYQHFLMETLPRLHLLITSFSVDIPIILTDARHIRDIVGILYPDQNFIFLSGGQGFDQPVECITISYVQKNLGRIHPLCIAAMRELRNKVIEISRKENIEPSSLVSAQSVSIGRRTDNSNSGSARIMINQSEYTEYLNNAGYSEVFLEDYNLIQKARVLSSAKTIITPLGANIMNLMFADSAERIFLIPHKLAFWSPAWFIEFIKLMCTSAKSVEVIECVTIHDGPHKFNKPFSVEIEALGKAINNY